MCQFSILIHFSINLFYLHGESEPIKLDSSLHLLHCCPFVVAVRLERRPPFPTHSTDYRLRNALIRFLLVRRQTMNDTFWQLSPNRPHSRCAYSDAVQNSAVIPTATNAPPTMQPNLNCGITMKCID